MKPEIETVVRAIKQANPGWGYQRIADAALTSKSNVARILRTPRQAADKPAETPTDSHDELAAAGR